MGNKKKMKLKSKYDVRQKVHFIDFPFAQERNCLTVKVETGKVRKIIFDGKSIKYDISTDSVYHSEVKEKHTFKRKDKAKMYIFNKYT